MKLRQNQRRGKRPAYRSAPCPIFRGFVCPRPNVKGRCAGEWIGLGSHDIQTAAAGENRCSEKNGAHNIAPELSAFSFLSSEAAWLA
jgi:hypothetical protein